MFVALAAVAFAQEDPALRTPPSYGFNAGFEKELESSRILARIGLLEGDLGPAIEVTAKVMNAEHVSGASKRDSDKDGLADWVDLCPEVSAKRATFGCPEVGAMSRAALNGRHRDLTKLKLEATKSKIDALSGYAWTNPVIAAMAHGGFMNLVPGDPIAALALGYFPTEKVTRKDRDGDGVADDLDGCPDERGFWGRSGQSNISGCPWTSPEPRELDAFMDDLPPLLEVDAPKPAEKPVAVAPPAKLPSVDGRLLSGKKATKDTGVVIGLEDYLVIPDVPYAKRDADAFYNFLVYTRGVPQEKIQVLSSGSNDHIATAVTRAAREVGPGGTVWVYFAGHGAANPKTGERMLLGDDVRSDAIGFASRGIEVAEIERLASANGGTPMLVLDTCYSGVGRTGGTLIAGTRFAVPQLDRLKTAAGMEWNAASADQVSGPLEPVQHGAFTYFAVGALRGWADGELDGVRDGKITGTEAQAYVRRALRVHQKNDQQPVWIGPTDPILSEGSEKGPDF